MKNVFVAILFLLSISSSIMFAQTDEGSLSKLLSPELSYSNQFGEKVLSPLFDQSPGENSAILKSKSRWKPKSEKTTQICGMTLPNGVEAHIAKYSKFAVMTVLNGPDCGKQIIFTDYNNPKVLDSSQNCEAKANYTVHRYTWGRIYSYYQSAGQEIRVKK